MPPCWFVLQELYAYINTNRKEIVFELAQYYWVVFIINNYNTKPQP